MRRFDPRLSDAEIARIAAGIDEQRANGAAVHRSRGADGVAATKQKRLSNADEPVTRFSVADS
jgi:hypothetical protein